MKDPLLTLDLLSYLYMITCFHVVRSLRITDFKVPKRVSEGSEVLLICNYDLEGYPLYTLKWYRNETEFFRHEPKAREPYMYLPVKGISLNRKKSNSTHVILSNVNKLTGGSFSCEVSTDILFQTQHQESPLIIDGGRSKSPGIFDNIHQTNLLIILIVQSIVSIHLIKTHFRIKWLI